MAIARAGDIELSYDRGGSGPPLLLIMGMSGTALHWGEPFLEDLRRDFDVIAYDHRGVGESTRLEGPLTIPQLADDAANLLAALELDSAHVMGISMGGMIAQELVLRNPDAVRTLTLGCTYCGGPDSSLTTPEVMGRLAAAMQSGDRALALRTGWEINMSSRTVDDADSYRRFLDAAEQYAVAVPVIMAQLQAIAVHDTSDRLGEITTPTLVVHGTDDLLLPVRNGEVIAGKIPGARLEILDGIGHMFFWEVPAEAAALVRDHAWTSSPSS
jgi:3-oxoadipate enol-lactonase